MPTFNIWISNRDYPQPAATFGSRPEAEAAIEACIRAEADATGNSPDAISAHVEVVLTDTEADLLAGLRAPLVEASDSIRQGQASAKSVEAVTREARYAAGQAINAMREELARLEATIPALDEAVETAARESRRLSALAGRRLPILDKGISALQDYIEGKDTGGLVRVSRRSQQVVIADVTPSTYAQAALSA